MALNVLSTVGAPLASGDTLSLGESYTFTVNTNQNAFVNTTNGVPYILLNNGGHAVYTSGSGTKALTFTYTVGAQPGETGVADLSTATTDALKLNGGAIADSSSPGGSPLAQLRNADGQSATGAQAVDAICFYPGTLVATPSGEVAVETLAAGDLVLTADGDSRPVRWLGRQTVSTRFADPLRVLPVRIAAGALGENLPRRDLLVSADHALLVDGVLVQAGALVDGAAIRREAGVPEVFTYWHVELADHALVLAEGVPAETFVDNVARLAFDNWDEHEAAGSEAPVAEMALPRAKSRRQVPAGTRRRLAERAALLLGGRTAAA